MVTKETNVADHYVTVLSNVRTSPKWSFKGRAPANYSSDAPGPGQYQPGVNGRFHNAAKFGFGTSSRDIKYTTTAPGPGQYQPQVKHGEPQYSMTPRRNLGGIFSRNDTPGAGTYIPGNVTHRSAPNYGFGSAERRAMTAPTSPGPGAYSPSRLHEDPKWGMGTAGRAPLLNPGKAPGPGTYELPSKVVEGPKWSVTSRRDVPSRAGQSPGPGMYENKTCIGEKSKYSFGLKTTTSTRHRDAPGPGAYEPSVKPATPHAPVWGFGTGKRDDIASGGRRAPGPGQYNPANPNFVAPNWGFGTGQRSSLGSRNASPGPGTYQPPVKLAAEAPKYSMTPRRADLSRAQTPGPGTYAARDTKTAPPKWGFGTSSRQGLAGKGVAPGPGTYNMGSTMAGPKWSLRSRDPGLKPNMASGTIGPTYTQFGY